MAPFACDRRRIDAVFFLRDGGRFRETDPAGTAIRMPHFDLSVSWPKGMRASSHFFGALFFFRAMLCIWCAKIDSLELLET